MIRRFSLALALWVAGGVVLCGCATGHRAGWRGGASRWPVVARVDAQMESHARYADGVIHEARGDLEAAMDSFTAAARAMPDDEELILDVSRRFLQYKHPERALPILTNAAARSNVSAEVLVRLGVVYAELGQLDRALAVNEKAVRKDPSLFAAQQSLVAGQLQNKQPEQALRTLAAAAVTPGVDAEYLLGVAELYSGIGMVLPAQRTNIAARTRELLLRAARLNPTNTFTRLKLADGLNRLGETAMAAEKYAAVVETLGENPAARAAVRLKLADLYLREGDRGRAAGQLEALLRDEPTHAQAQYILGTLAFESGRMEQAAECFGRTMLLNPAFEPAYYDLASAQLNLNKPAEAFLTLEKARERFQQTFLIEYLTGLTYAHRKDYAGAIKHYTAAEAVARTAETKRLTHTFFFQLGVAHERHGNFDTAAGYFEQCLALAPNFAEAQNYLGYLWAERGTNLDRAHELIERAVKAEPENEAYLDSLAWVLFKLGKPAEALDPMLRALKHAEKPDATLYDHLGDIQAALGDMNAAREAWHKALEIEPNETIRKKLESAAPK